MAVSDTKSPRGYAPRLNRPPHSLAICGNGRWRLRRQDRETRALFGAQRTLRGFSDLIRRGLRGRALPKCCAGNGLRGPAALFPGCVRLPARSFYAGEGLCDLASALAGEKLLRDGRPGTRLCSLSGARRGGFRGLRRAATGGQAAHARRRWSLIAVVARGYDVRTDASAGRLTSTRSFLYAKNRVRRDET